MIPGIAPVVGGAAKKFITITTGRKTVSGVTGVGVVSAPAGEYGADFYPLGVIDDPTNNAANVELILCISIEDIFVLSFLGDTRSKSYLIKFSGYFGEGSYYTSNAYYIEFYSGITEYEFNNPLWSTASANANRTVYIEIEEV